MTSLAVNPTSPETVFAGTTNGIFRTADAGAHWVPVWAPDARDVNVSAIAVDRPDPATIYATVEGPYSWSREGLLRSTDSGETWERVPSLTSLVGDDPDFFALALVRGQGTSLLVAVNGRLYASDDGGGSWTELGGLPRIWTLWVDPHSPTTVYTRGGLDREASGLYRSDDAGGHWQAVSTPDGEAVVALAVDEPSAVLYAGTGSGVFRSSDAGASWERTAYPGNASLIALNPANPSDLLVAGEDGGLRRSVDGGGTFRRVTVAGAETASVIFANADTVLAGGLGVLVSRDRGQTWRAANTGLVATSVDWLAADAKQPGLAYAITDSSDVVLRTTDGGRSWIEVGPDTTENNPVSDRLFSDPRRTGVVYLAAGDDLYMTQDSGTHWRAAGIHGFVRWLAVDPSSGTLYAACGEGCYWRPGLWTKRPGRAWRRLEPGYPIAVAVDGHGTVYASFEGSLRRSLEGGKTWRRLGLSSIRQVFADPRHPRRVYAIGDDTLYASASRGQTWQQPVGAGVGTLLVDPARDRVLVTRAYYEEGDPLLVLRRIHGRWRTTSGGFPELGVNSLAAGAGTIYAGTAGAGVYVLASGQPRPAPRPRVR